MNLLRMKARPLLAAPFIVDGLSALTKPEPHAEKVDQAWTALERFGLPPLDHDQVRLAARLSGALSVGTATYFVLGKHKRTAATLLAGLTVPLALINAPVWMAGDKQERREASRKLMNYGVLFAGMLLASTDRVGEPSLSWKRAYGKQQRQLIATIKEEAAATAVATTR